jgi:MFS family permease
MTQTLDDAGLSPRPTRRRYVVMAFLCALAFLTYFDRVCIMRAQEDIQRDLGLTTGQMGLVLGAFWAAYSLFEIPGGWMGDRYGTRGTLTRVVLAWSVFTALSGAATGFVTLLTYRLLFGAGEAGAFPNMARAQESWLPARTRARAGGLLWLTARFGAAFSPLLFGTLLRTFDSSEFRSALAAVGLPSGIPAWRFGFWAAGLVGLVWCLAFFPWFRDDPAAMRSVNDAELKLIRRGREKGRTGASHHMPRHVWMTLLRSPSLWALGALYVCVSFGWSFFVSWMPRYLKEVHGITFEQSEIRTGLPLLCGGIACLVGGAISDWLVRRTGRKRLFRAAVPVAGYLIAAGAMYAVRFAEDADQVALLMCLAGAAVDFGQGANWATIVDVGGRYAGTATGLVNMVGNTGNTIQPYVGAKIVEQAGWDALMGTYSVAFLCAAGLWAFINPNRTFYGEATPGAAREPETGPELAKDHPDPES